MTDKGSDQFIGVITGGTSGIGAAAAVALARPGARLILVGRDAARGEAVANAARHNGAIADVLTADLSSVSATRELAARITELSPRLDAVVLNAAVALGRRELTAEGYEVDFATNYLSPFVLIRELAAVRPARVVVVGSAVHTRVKEIDLGGLARGDDFSQTRTYAATKLLDLLFSAELARRTAGTGATCNAVDPGFVRTRLGRSATGGVGMFLKAVRPFQVKPERPGEVIARLAADPAMRGETGGYFGLRGPVTPSAPAQDPVLAARVWRETEALLGAA